MKTRLFGTGIWLFLLIFFANRLALAHNEESRLELNLARLNPGATLEIRGVGFEAEEVLHLGLIGSNSEIDWGATSTDMEGGFTLIIALPTDLPIGEYTVAAVTYDQHVTSAVVTVWGAALTDEEGEQRGQEEPLLNAMPERQAIAPAQSTTNSLPAPSLAVEGSLVWWWPVGVATAVIVLLVH